MEKWLVALSVDKIQQYIYQRIDDSAAEKLDDKKTLSQICYASQNISQKIEIVVQEVFEKHFTCEEKFLVRTSGKMIFEAAFICEKELQAKEKELFAQLYTESNGRIFVRYCHEKKKASYKDNLQQVKNLEKTLIFPRTKSKVIGENQDLIFAFRTTDKETTIFKPNTNGTDRRDEAKEYDVLCAKSMDDLISPQIRSEGQRGKIAIVKADLNDMGKIFRSLSTMKEYDELSKSLKRNISMKGFLDQIALRANLWGRIIPFYVAGDDIFYAVSISRLAETITLLKRWVDDLNQEIATQSKDFESPIELSMAIGIAIVDNHQPLRYYREEVEEELNSAKGKMKEKRREHLESIEKAKNEVEILNENESEKKKDAEQELKVLEEKPIAVLGISFCGYQFYSFSETKEVDCGKETGAEQKDNSKKDRSVWGHDNWHKFIREMNQLVRWRQKGIFSTSYLQKLIHMLEATLKPSEKMHLLLYHLIPEMKELDVKGSEEVCEFKALLAKMVLVKEERKNGPWKFDPKKIDMILLPRIRLFLLLTDERYQEEDLEGAYIPKESKEEVDKKTRAIKINNLKRTLFNRPMDYIYNEYKKEKEWEILSLFIEEHIISKAMGKKKKPIRIYQMARFYPTMFFRAKAIGEVESDPIDKWVRLFLSANAVSQQRIEQEHNAADEQDKAASSPEGSIYQLSFNESKFCEVIESWRGSQCSLEWLDALCIFYMLSDAKMKFSRMFSNNEA